MGKERTGGRRAAGSALGGAARRVRVQHPQSPYSSVVHDPEAVQHVSVMIWRVSFRMPSQTATTLHAPKVSVHVTSDAVENGPVERWTVCISCTSEDADTASPGS
jgi:hypothetical protein